MIIYLVAMVGLFLYVAKESDKIRKKNYNKKSSKELNKTNEDSTSK